MEPTLRTIYGSALQVAQMLGVPYVIKANTTLNERFEILQDAVIADSIYPRVAYFCIGNGGHQSEQGADSIPLVRQVQHRATDASVYKPIPFVLRAINNDLTALERAKYALRRLEVHSGISYYAYYLKRIPLDNVTVDMEHRTTDDSGITTATTFIATPANLVPLPPLLSNVGTNVLTDEYVTVAARLSIALTKEECTEILDACRIVRGDDRYAIISEIGICSGAPKVVLLEDNTNFEEAVGVQITTHVATFHQVRYAASGIGGLFDLGTAEPLFALDTAAPSVVL